MTFFSSDRLNKVNLNALSAFNVIDPFAIEYDDKQYQVMTDTELIAAKGSVLIFDVESFFNYFLVSFKCPVSKKIVFFEDDETKEIQLGKLRWVLDNFCIVGFNSFSYDIPMLCAALAGLRAHDLKVFGNLIIYENYHRKQIEEELRVNIYHSDNYKIPAWNHIDLIEVAPLQASLKLYSGRLHAQRMQELDIDPEKQLTDQEKKVVKHYNINDLDNTELLMTELTPALELRTKMSNEYRQDLRSRSDAQIAEAVIGSELAKLNGYWPRKNNVSVGTILYYEKPSWMQFEFPQLQDALKLIQNAQFKVGENGGPEMPQEIENLSITIGESTYKIGIGGLHSTESCIAHKATDDVMLIDKDVASYYPSIILNLGLFPQHLGKNFLRVYRGIVNRRLEAKKAGDKVTNESLKITINGTFGKLGNRWSILYAPDRIIQVLMNGQLSLLLLIEILERTNIRVISANTDGVLLKCSKDQYPFMVAAVTYWERLTGFQTEETKYRAVYQRDVNNYIAVKEDDTTKVKGAYAEKGSSGNSFLAKNPEHLIVADAVIGFLSKGTDISSTIRNCKDIRRFVTVRNVKGGGEKSGVFLGRAVRWYYSTSIQGEINYRTTGNKVPKSENAMPLMVLPKELPADIDYERYIKIAEDTLHDIGYYGRGETVGRLF